MMLVFLPSYLSLSLLLPETSRGLGQPPPRQGGGRRLRHWDRWPGFRDEAAQGQRGLVEQGHQDQVPAPAKDTHQPQAGGTPRPRLPGDQGRDVRDGADWDRLLGLAPNAQQPQGGSGHGQPQARGPVGLRHVRALPRPAGALGDLEALLDPGPQPIPTGGTGLRRQVRQEQPWIFVPRLPAGQQGAVQLAVTAFESDARSLPGGARLGHQGLQRHPTHLALGPKGAPRVDAQKRVPPQPRDAPKQPAGVQTAIRTHEDRPGPWHRPAYLAQHAQPLPAPGMFGRRRQDGPRYGNSTAPIDYTDRQDGKAGAQGCGIKGQGQLRALPLAYDPGQQWRKARLDDKRAACRPTFGRGLIAKLTPLLAHRRFFATQPRRQERTDGRQRTGAGQHHAQTPQGQDRRLWLGQMGQVRLDNAGPFGHTGVARHPYPPWGDGSEATSHTMPHRGVSCHLLYAVVPSCFKNLLQKEEIVPPEACPEHGEDQGVPALGLVSAVPEPPIGVLALLQLLPMGGRDAGELDRVGLDLRRRRLHPELGDGVDRHGADSGLEGPPTSSEICPHESRAWGYEHREAIVVRSVLLPVHRVAPSQVLSTC